MAAEIVDQIAPDGGLVQDVDTRLSPSRRMGLLLQAVPGAVVETYAGVKVVRLGNQVILSKQVTHLGRPWPGFKKRIQIPKSWIDVSDQASEDGLEIRFVGVYHYGDVTIFVDFDPSTYLRRKANNSAAHVSTNDLHQAQIRGQFSREDRNGNLLSSVRADEFHAYLTVGYEARNPRLEALRLFSEELFREGRVEALEAVQEMHAASWPDTFQGEWPGFFLEFRLDRFLREKSLQHLIEFQKDKVRGRFDFDLVFKSGAEVEFYGDLKASDVTKRESPGNDAEDFRRCLSEYGRFWYVIYEHETTHGRDSGHVATIAWNEWKQSVGYSGRKVFNPLSYANRFKASVHFVKMSVLEVNEANVHVVLRDFAQGRQPDGAARALKVMINKTNVDNFLLFSHRVADSPIA